MRWLHTGTARVLWAMLGLCCAWGLAQAQVGSPNDCSGSGEVAAALVSFPKAGTTGPTMPQQYVTIQNVHASNSLWVNPMRGGSAAVSTAGSFELTAGATISWAQPSYAPPARISIVASGGGTPYTCAYQ